MSRVSNQAAMASRPTRKIFCDGRDALRLLRQERPVLLRISREIKDNLVKIISHFRLNFPKLTTNTLPIN
jgi:hypothetical protein